MGTIWQAFGATLQPVAVSLATVAVLALVRLITPSVRWSRRLKRDSEIYATLPDGKEKEMWASSVTAQAERVRIYREDFSVGQQVLAWYAFIVVTTAPVALISDASLGWPAVNELTEGNVWTVIFGAFAFVLNYTFAAIITVQLILGRSTVLTAGTGGHYPRYDVLSRTERRRKEKRSDVERRLARTESQEGV